MKETETTTDKPTPERAHSRTEGRGEPRIVQMLNQEAADAEAVAQWLEGNIHNARKQKNCRDRAALYRRVARLYNEDHGEPLTESGAEWDLPLSAVRMIICPDCGNKRCPKASDHLLACTQSNEPGQVGSIYANDEPTDQP